MDKRGNLKVVLIVFLVLALLVGIFFVVFHFKNKGSVSCEETPEGESILRMPLANTLAGGKQTGAEIHEFVNGEKISVCCADVISGDERKFKDCIHYNVQGKQDYQVVWEEKNGFLVKIKEDLPWQGSQCTYDFEEDGETWSGRFCYDPNEEQESEVKENLTSLADCPTIAGYERDSCYKDIAILKKDKSICAQIQIDYVQSICYREVACETGDVSICEMFEDELGITNSQTSACYACVAIKTNNGSLCAKISGNPSSRDLCYSKFKSDINPESVFSISNLNCGINEASLDITLNEDVELTKFAIGFSTDTKELYTGSSSKYTIDETFEFGETNRYNIVYTNYMSNFVGPAKEVSIAFATVETGDYVLGPINC